MREVLRLPRCGVIIIVDCVRFVRHAWAVVHVASSHTHPLPPFPVPSLRDDVGDEIFSLSLLPPLACVMAEFHPCAPICRIVSTLQSTVRTCVCVRACVRRHSCSLVKRRVAVRECELRHTLQKSACRIKLKCIIRFGSHLPL